MSSSRALILVSAIAAVMSQNTLARDQDVAEKLTDLILMTKDVRKNGDASLFAYDYKKFDVAAEIARLKDHSKNYLDCGFLWTSDSSQNIAELKKDIGNASLIDQMTKKNEIVKVLRAHWNGIESLNATPETCLVNIYKIYGSDGSGLSIELTATQ